MSVMPSWASSLALQVREGLKHGRDGAAGGAVAFGARTTAASAARNVKHRQSDRAGPPIPRTRITTRRSRRPSTRQRRAIGCLFEPGTYYEAVKVTSAQSGIWIRGMDRNKVIVDGQKKPGNGIEIYKANKVWVDNLTVRNFDTGCENCRNGIWWNGGSGSGKSARPAGMAAI